MHAGAEMDLYFIARELSQHDRYAVSFVTGDFGQPAQEIIGRITVIKSFRTNLTGLARQWYKFFVSLPKFWHALSAANADVYIQEGAGLETGVIALFCRLRRRLFVYRVASTIDCNGVYRRQSPLLGRWYEYGLRRANVVIAQDQEESELLHRHYQITATIIPNTTPIPPESELLPLDQRQHILWISRLVKMKHPEIVLDIAQHFPDERFVLVTSPDNNDLSFAREISARAARIPNVTLLPRMPSEQLQDWYRKAKVFLSTSEFEGFPNTFIEAGKYGVPVLSLTVDPNGLLSDQRFGQSASGHQQAFIEQIRAWLQDSSRRQRSGSDFRHYVQDHHDITRVIHAYTGLLDQITDHRLR